MTRVILGALALVTVITAPAAADSWRERGERVQGGAFLHYELTGLTIVDEQADRMAGPLAHELVLAGARLHGFVSANASVAYHIGLDVGFGGAIREGGFAYDCALFPVGILVRGGETSFIGFAAGVGISGATGSLDDAVSLPLEVTLELGRKHRLLARGRVSYIAGADSRQSAAPSIPFADELDAMVGFRIGRAYDRYGMNSGNGYFIGASYRELAGSRMLGLTIGYSIDLALPRHWRTDATDE